jgi:hypothetical protein
MCILGSCFVVQSGGIFAVIAGCLSKRVNGHAASVLPRLVLAQPWYLELHFVACWSLQSSTADFAALERDSGHLGCLQLGYWVVNHLVVFGHPQAFSRLFMACSGILHRVGLQSWASHPSMLAGNGKTPQGFSKFSSADPRDPKGPRLQGQRRKRLWKWWQQN